MDDIPLPSFYQPMFREEITALLAYVDEQCEKMQQYIGQEHNILGPVLETFKKIETKSQGRDNRNYLKFRYREWEEKIERTGLVLPGEKRLRKGIIIIA